MPHLFCPGLSCEVLQGFYNKKSKGTALAQNPEAPAGFKAYKKQGGGGVVQMLTNIIAEANTAEVACQIGVGLPDPRTDSVM